MISLGSFNLVLLALPAFALRIAIPAMYGRKRMAADDPMHVLLSLSSSIMFVLAGLGLITGLAGFWFLLIPLPFIFAILILMAVDRARRGQHRALLNALATAAQHGIPLPEAARAFADEALGDPGLRSLALAEALERGMPLSAAVRRARLRMGTGMRLAVRLGERLDQLGPALRSQLDDSLQIDMALRDIIGRLVYVVMIVVFMGVVCAYMMIKIVPIFQRMFEEFGLKLPAMTHVVIDSSRWFVNIGWAPTMPLIVIVLPALLVLAVLYYVGWFPRNLPVIWRLFKRYDGALVMRSLALAIRRATPLPSALRLVAETYPLSIVAGRLHQAANRVEAGMPWCESLQRTGLVGQADAAVLAAAERVGNLEWALEEMANSAVRRQIYRLQAWLQVLFPAAILAVGLFVFVFVCGLFMPLVALIQGLA